MIGEDAVDEYENFKWDADGDDKKINKVILKFKEFCEKDDEVNITIVRHTFLTYVREQQKPGQTLIQNVDEFLKELRILVRPCGYKDLENEMLRDRIVAGINSTTMTKRLLSISKLDLTKAISMTRAWEMSETSAKSLGTVDEPAAVAAVQKKKSYTKKPTGKKRDEKSDEKSHGTCTRCGFKHGKKCPAYNEKCRK